MMERMIPPQVGMRLRKKNKEKERKEAIKKEKIVSHQLGVSTGYGDAH